MALKIITNIFLIILLATAQISFISGLPGWLSYLNLFLVALIFILGLANLDLAWWWAVGLGFLLEIFSFWPFGLGLFSLVLTVAFANFLLNYFFTNRSLYSFLALISLATLFYEIILNTGLLIFTEPDGFFLVNKNFWLMVLEMIIVNALLTFIIYYLVYFLGRNLRPVFLIKKLNFKY